MLGNSLQQKGRTDWNDTGPSAGSADEKVARVQAFLHGVSLILTHHRCPPRVIADFLNQARAFLTVDKEELFLKRAKYMILWPMAEYLKNEAPPPPDQPFHFTGRFWRWARQRLHCFSRKNTHLWYSFLQSKRAGLPVSPAVVLANFQKHRDQMQIADPLSLGDDADNLLDEILENLEPMLSRLSKKLHTILEPTFRYPEKEIHKASESASLEATRSKGGQAGQIRKLIGVNGIREQDTVLKMNIYPETVYDGSFLQHQYVEEVRGRHGELEDLEDLLAKEVSKYRNDVPMLKAKVEAVLEPFKVRTISKGESLPYYLAKRVQLALHGEMRKLSCFRLIGRPLDPPDLMDIIRETDKYSCSSELEWLSVDYSAATDGLSARLSQAILRRLLDPLYFENPAFFNMLLGVLAPHEISYPEVDGVQLEPVVQKNGQLMGSILSFPILCLANLGLYLTVKKRTHPWASTKILCNSVLVNGDDMLYCGDRFEWNLHAELGKRIGLEMSPGKAYIHPIYANVNSTSLHCDLSRQGIPTVIRFLNVGLMMGRHKVLGKVGSDDVVKTRPATTVIDEVVRGSLRGLEAEVFKRYCSMHAKEISRECKGRNLFLSEKLGGLGVSLIKGIDTEITPRQARYAYQCLRDNPFLRRIENPMPLGFYVHDVVERFLDPIRLQKEGEPDRFPRPNMIGPYNPKELLWPWWDSFIPYPST